MSEIYKLSLANIVVETFGGSPVAVHNMPCAICGQNKAVLNMNSGKFQPCWNCQKKGFVTIKLPKWLKRYKSYIQDKYV